MAKVEQAVVRTYPYGWRITTGDLQKYLSNGYTVVLVNQFEAENQKGLEYIVQKVIEE